VGRAAHERIGFEAIGQGREVANAHPQLVGQVLYLRRTLAVRDFEDPGSAMSASTTAAPAV
jgi:hypothetical protein